MYYSLTDLFPLRVKSVTECLRLLLRVTTSFRANTKGNKLIHKWQYNENSLLIALFFFLSFLSIRRISRMNISWHLFQNHQPHSLDTETVFWVSKTIRKLGNRLLQYLGSWCAHLFVLSYILGKGNSMKDQPLSPLPHFRLQIGQNRTPLL